MGLYTNAAVKKGVCNIYMFPPAKLAEGSGEWREIKRSMVSVLIDSHEARSLMGSSSITAEEVAGFMIAIAARVESILTRVRDQIPDDKRPRTLNMTLRTFLLSINPLSDERKPDVHHELFHVASWLHRDMESFQNIFSRVDDTVADFDKELVCDKFLEPLRKWFFRLKEWGLAHAASSSMREDYASILRAPR